MTKEYEVGFFIDIPEIIYIKVSAESEIEAEELAWPKATEKAKAINAFEHLHLDYAEELDSPSTTKE